MLGFLKRTTLSDRQEAAVKKTLSNLRAQRRTRFRILACIDGSEESMLAVKTAAQFAVTDECDIIILYVRALDQGLHSGGLQVRLARQNMMEAGFELPGVQYLRRAIEVLKEQGIDVENWALATGSQAAWGDAAGDTKVEYKNEAGRAVVLKLKIAPDVSAGILDQYELGPYNLIILGQPERWKSEFQAFFGAGVVQTVTTVAPCSVMVARDHGNRHGFLLCTDGTSRSMQAVRRSAVLAHVMQEPITLFSVAPDNAGRPAADEAVKNAASILKAMKIEVAAVKTAVGDVVEEIVENGSLYRVVAITDEGRSRLQRLFKGSTASEVLRRARTSVLDIR
jgi:nucleotide-binding universal stress UspA family protein